jgi:glycerol-3-phosphate dehydrogenase
MQADRVKTLVEAFSVSRRPEIDAAWELAHSMGDELLALLAEAFPQIRKSAGRASVMRYVGKFSRENNAVFGMGIVAAQDRSYAVRHYGCALLAYSLRSEALTTLSTLLKHRDQRTVADARAAIDAIKSKNHHFFHDRGHSGKIRWEYASI